MGLISEKKLEKLENSKESEGSEWSKVQGKDRKAKMKGKGGIVDAKIDPKDLNSVLSLIVQAITVLVDQQDILREHKVRIDDLEKQSRAQGDLLDEIQQRSMKGNLILSGVAGKNKPT